MRLGSKENHCIWAGIHTAEVEEMGKVGSSPSWLLLSSSLYFFCRASSASSWAMRPWDSCLPSSWFSWISMRHLLISFFPVWLQRREAWHHEVNKGMVTGRQAQAGLVVGTWTQHGTLPAQPSLWNSYGTLPCKLRTHHGNRLQKESWNRTKWNPPTYGIRICLKPTESYPFWCGPKIKQGHSRSPDRPMTT